MKKVRILLMTFVMLLCMSGVAMADDTKVYVSIADNNGAAVLVQKPVTVTDVDSDGALTVGDALVCAHEAYFEGGAAKGIKTSVGTYGLQLDLLWGYDNGTGYGYLVNNAFSMGLGDPVKDGDYVYAYIYTDLTTWSDTYCFFDKNTVSATAGDSVSVVLSAAGYAADYSQLNSQVEGATILVDGKEAGVVTDAEGKAAITFDAAGEHVISAKKDGMVMVPPLCVATVAAKEEPTPEPTAEPVITAAPEEKHAVTVVPAKTEEKKDDSKSNTTLYIVIGAVVLLIAIVVAVFCLKKKKN
ncbi:MAG: hypothetical protein J6S78_10140 [Lachnospiraceae bacterium]|nr:hypothetical protein [Lachnospiraceae bacterium]